MKNNIEMDLELVNKIKANDRNSNKAFNELFNKYYISLLNNYKYSIKDEALAEDLAMITLTKAYKNIEKYSIKEGAFSTWIFKIAKNLFIDELRKRKINAIHFSKMCLTDSDGNTSEIEFGSTIKNPEETLESCEKSDMIKDIIKTTFKDQKNFQQLVELRFVCEISYKDIAKITNLPIGTIKANIFRARKTLKEAFKKQNVNV